MMLFERSASLSEPAAFAIFGSAFSLLFGVIDVLQRVEEEVVEVFVLGGVGALRCETLSNMGFPVILIVTSPAMFRSS